MGRLARLEEGAGDSVDPTDNEKMVSPSSQFEHPPVVELVLGVQFAPLSHFTGGHLGWFWKQFLDPEWDRSVDAAPLPDQVETFDEQRRWGVGFMLQSAVTSPRLQIGNKAGDRLIQIQPTRFHYNWQKKDATYPSYHQIYAEFDRHLERFRQFVAEAGLGKIVPNQWEITYVDRILRGELWQSVAEWHNVVPGLLSEPGVEGLEPEGINGEWNFEITPRRGRVHVAIGQAHAPERKESALLIQTTARGPIGKEAAQDLKAGLDLGHEYAVRSFLRLTSPAAHKIWGINT